MAALFSTLPPAAGMLAGSSLGGLALRPFAPPSLWAAPSATGSAPVTGLFPTGIKKENKINKFGN